MRLSRDLYLILVFLALFLLAGIFFGWGEPSGSYDLHPYSTFDSGPEGLLGLYLYLEEKGLSVARWRRPLTELERRRGDVLFLVDVGEDAFAPREWPPVRQWIEAGGVLVTAAPDPANAVNRMPLSLTGPPRVANGRFVPDGPWLSLVADPGGAVAVTSALGRGRIILLADPRLLTNAGLPVADNLALAVNLAHAAGPDGRVLFDEYHHGFAVQEGLWSVLPPPVRPALAQLGLVGAAFLYWRGRRFGPVLPLPVAPPRPAAELVTAAAALYRRMGARAAILGYLYRPLRQELSRLAGADPGLPSEELARRATRRRALDVDDLADLLRRCEAAGAGGTLGERSLLDLAGRIEAYRKELASHEPVGTGHEPVGTGDRRRHQG